MLFASILYLSEMFGNYLQQTTFSDAFFLGALRVNKIDLQDTIHWHIFFMPVGKLKIQTSRIFKFSCALVYMQKAILKIFM